MDGSPDPRPVPWLSPEDEEVWRSFVALSHGMDHAVDRQLQRDSELSRSEYEILVPLSESGTGELTSRELLRVLGWERSRLSHMLSRMERRGMIRRAPVPRDARGLLVAITEHGRETTGRAAPGHLFTVREAFVDRLDEGEKAALLSIARKVLPHLETMEPG
ncbi:MarR family winged helix-turn-helix transcriptional regulator [Kocuria sp.]|uniref:MarR family winged helix-turn-helix transcriptional regulator n=1 Tax=Kocuria sp. TaxID=1871328 RepID=UPI0026DC2E33|nr:MarR family transcriptional regulator [Kocuria sp.]MDO4918187.1 MarR family transcriptional regulator [Kocuria sp.]